MSHRKEAPPVPEFNLQLTEAYAHSFIHRRDCYPMQLENGNYVTVQKPLTSGLLMAHIEDKMTLGAYALNEESLAHWLCLDADDADEWQHLLKLVEYLELEGITSYLECSRRGGHLWLFTAPLPGKTVRQFGKQLLVKNDLLQTIEVYPKQDELKTGVGSLVRLPLGIHRKSGRRYHFITPKYEPIAPTIRQQMAILSTPARVPDTFIKRIVAEIPKPAPPSKKEGFTVKEQSHEKPLSERIKAAISVYDFVSRYVELDARGIGRCPFHQDENPSFGVNRPENYWACWAGCGGGSIVDFYMKWREKQGLDASFTATITELAQMLFP